MAKEEFEEIDGRIYSVKTYNRVLNPKEAETIYKRLSKTIEVPRELLESLKNDVIELAVENNWRRMSTKWHQQYLEELKNKISQVEELLADKNKARGQDSDG